jgi:DNA invertase Pin-like site-specific DNA recombinase
MEGGNEIEGAKRSAPPIVAGYIRVSSRSQDYEYQRHAIQLAARARGELVHLWYGDVASGRSMDRPQLLKLRDAIRAHRVQRLWVWRIDRLTRSGIVDTLSCINEIRLAGCAVASVADGFALDGPAADVILAVLAWAAQLERQKIRENLAAARARLALQGRHMGPTPVPTHVRALVKELSDAGLSIRRVARAAGISKSSVWNILHEVPIVKLAV